MNEFLKTAMDSALSSQEADPRDELMRAVSMTPKSTQDAPKSHETPISAETTSEEEGKKQEKQRMSDSLRPLK